MAKLGVGCGWGDSAGDGRSLFVASEYQIYRLDNVLGPDDTSSDGHDALFVRHQSWITGDLDIHDIGFGADGRPVFANTLFNCLATVSDGYSFKPVWTPPFISRLAAEDRCHLNGMALADGAPAYVTAVSRSDVADGWRDRRSDGRLWLLNSGTGQFGTVDLASGDMVHWLRIEGMVQELYDVVALPGATRPAAIGFKADAIKQEQ